MSTNCYCLYCEAQRCGTITKLLNAMMDECDAVCPSKMQHTWSKGRMVDIRRYLMPGYVFIYTENRRLDYYSLPDIIGIYSMLKYPDGTSELRGDDKEFALRLREQGGLIESIKVYNKGEKLAIAEGNFAGHNAIILKADRRNKRIKVKIPFTGTNIVTWLKYEEI